MQTRKSQCTGITQWKEGLFKSTFKILDSNTMCFSIGYNEYKAFPIPLILLNHGEINNKIQIAEAPGSGWSPTFDHSGPFQKNKI